MENQENLRHFSKEEADNYHEIETDFVDQDIHFEILAEQCMFDPIAFIEECKARCFDKEKINEGLFYCDTSDTIQELFDETVAKSNELKAKEQLIENRDKRILNLSLTIENKDGEIEDLNVLVQIHEDDISDLKKELKKDEQAFEKLNQELKAKDEVLKTCKILFHEIVQLTENNEPVKQGEIIENESNYRQILKNAEELRNPTEDEINQARNVLIDREHYLRTINNDFE